MIKALVKKTWYAFFDEHPHVHYVKWQRTFMDVWYRFFEDHPFAYPGRVLATVLPGRYVEDAYENFYNHEGASHWTRKLIISAIRRRYFSEADHAKRRAVRERLWGGTAGRKWHAGREKEYSFDAFDDDAYRAELLRQIGVCQQAYPEPWTVVEVGVGNGVFLDYLAHRLEGVSAFIGVDLNRGQIADNRDKYKNSEMRFVHAEATDWIDAYREDNALLMVTCGVLAYLTQHELETMLRTAKNRSGRSAFAIRESVDLGFASRTKQSYPDSSDIDIGFVHNYSHLFKKHGFEILEEEDMPFFDRRRIVITAVSS